VIKTVVPKPLSVKGSHKTPPEAIRLILEMTVGGSSNGEIQKTLRDRFAISIHTNMIAYYRKKYREDLRKRYEEEYLEALTEFPEMVTLTGRLAMISRLIDAEYSKGEEASGLAIVRLFRIADQIVWRAELRRLAERESKYIHNSEEEHERILQEFERRSHIT